MPTVRTAAASSPGSGRSTEDRPARASLQPGPADHLVQLYADDHHLVAVVADYVAAGLRGNEAAVLIATPPHLRLVTRALGAAGIDVPSALALRQLLYLDAAQTLERLLVDGVPDRGRFRSVLAAALGHVRGAGPRGVRLFGEMVDLLWRRSVEATVALERLWDEALREEGLPLLCAYRMDPLERRLQGVLRRVTDCHSHLLPMDDPVRFEQAVDRAYSEVFGGGADVELLRDLMVTSLQLTTAMAEPQAVLLALDGMPRLVADDVRARARRYYARAA